MTKISNEIRLRIARESRSEVWKLDKLMKVIREEVEAREASEGSKSANSICQCPPIVDKFQGNVVFLVPAL